MQLRASIAENALTLSDRRLIKSLVCSRFHSVITVLHFLVVRALIEAEWPYMSSNTNTDIWLVCPILPMAARL